MSIVRQTRAFSTLSNVGELSSFENVNKLLSLLNSSLVGSGMACVTVCSGGEKMGDDASGSLNSSPFIHLSC